MQSTPPPLPQALVLEAQCLPEFWIALYQSVGLPLHKITDPTVLADEKAYAYRHYDISVAHHPKIVDPAYNAWKTTNLLKPHPGLTALDLDLLLLPLANRIKVSRMPGKYRNDSNNWLQLNAYRLIKPREEILARGKRVRTSSFFDANGATIARSIIAALQTLPPGLLGVNDQTGFAFYADGDQNITEFNL